MQGAIILLILYQIALPAALIFLLWKVHVKTLREWIGLCLFTILYILWIFFNGRWDWLSYYIRYSWILLLVIAIAKSYKQAIRLPFKRPPSTKGKWKAAGLLLIACIFLLRNIAIFSSFSLDGKETLALSFPLENGTYYIAHGGSSTEVNYHYAYPDQQYALDITQLNGLGLRVNGMYPKELDKYHIYGTPVHSPCSGKVIDSENNLPNLTPGEMDPEKPLGNHVALQCDNSQATVYLAHMKQHSVTVNKDASLTEGQVIGAVGNSGNTTEPHLHIHAEKNGAGVPMKLDETYPIRNSLIRK